MAPSPNTRERNGSGVAEPRPVVVVVLKHLHGCAVVRVGTIKTVQQSGLTGDLANGTGAGEDLTLFALGAAANVSSKAAGVVSERVHDLVFHSHGHLSILWLSFKRGNRFPLVPHDCSNLHQLTQDDVHLIYGSSVGGVEIGEIGIIGMPFVLQRCALELESALRFALDLV